MTQVSRYPVHKDVEKRMLKIFNAVISSLQDSSDIEDFLDDFLSPVEKIMLAKRLCIAVLLAKGYTYPEIKQILRVTPSTIANVSLNLKYSGKGYKKMVEKILSKEKSDEFWERIKDILMSGHSSSKSNDWLYLQEEYFERKKRKR